MKNHWLAALLCLVFAFVATGCGNPSAAGENKRRYGSAQTGTNIPRAIGPSTSTPQSRAKKERSTKAKRDKRAEKKEAAAKKAAAEKSRREKRERRPRATDEEVVTRGGFR